jgi:uncharacterized membrane protein YccC
MHNPRMPLTHRLRQHPLLQTLLVTNQRDVPWLVAARNTAAVVLPLAIGAAIGHLIAGLAVSAGALNTMFADQPGPYLLRAQRLLLTSLAAGSAAFAGSILGQWPLALLVAAAVWGFAAAMLVAIGPNATRAGMISMILLMVLGAEPRAAAQALPTALLIIAGGVLQTVFAILAWPLQRYRPERMAMAAALRALANEAGEDVGHDNPIALPPSLNDLQEMLFGAGRARGRAVEAFQVLAEQAERVRVESLALADLQSASRSPSLRDALQAIRRGAAEVLVTLADALERAEPPASEHALARYATATQRLAEWNVSSDASQAWIVQIANARAAALGGQLRAATRNAEAAGSRGEARIQNAELQLPRALRPANPLAILRANLDFSSVAFRHALRCGVCLALALALAHLLSLSRGYWIPMTVAIVLKPDFGATWRYGLLRVSGTLGGLLLTTTLLHFGFDDFREALLLFTILCFAYRELATVHYGVGVACLTGVVVILLSFYGIAPEASMIARANDTVIGSALALIAYLVWPTWERSREREVLAGLLDAYRDYLDAVLRGDPRRRRDTRTAARAARSNALASLDRLRQEPNGRHSLPRAETLVTQANRLIRAAMALEAARDDTKVPPNAYLDEFARACDAALREAADALRESREPRGDQHLRARQQALAASLPEPGDAFDASLRDVSDRSVDAIDSLLHLLGQSHGNSSTSGIAEGG